MYQTKLSHMFNCVNTGSTRLSKQRKFRIYVLDDFLGNCYNGSLFARYGNCCFGQLFAKSLFQTSLENCCCGTLFHPNFANNCCGSFCFPIFQFCHCKTVFFCKFCRRESFMKIFMLTLRWFKIKWSGCPGRLSRPGGPGGPVGHDQDSQGR